MTSDYPRKDSIILNMLQESEALVIKYPLIAVKELLYLTREHFSFTQKMLSQKSKIPQPSISRIEKGDNQPNLATLHKLFNAMGCNLFLLPVYIKKKKK